MDAFVESILKFNGIDDRRYVVNTFVAAQGDHKGVEGYLKALARAQQEKNTVNEAEDFLLAFQGGFKGIG